MAFWDNLGEKFSQGAQTISRGSQEAVRRTRDMAAVTSLQIDVRQAKEKIRELEAGVGHLVLEESFAGKSEEEIRSAAEGAQEMSLTTAHAAQILDAAAQIAAQRELIRQKETKIARIRGEVRCPSCGKLVSHGVKFCPECGASLEEVYAAERAEQEAQRQAQEAQRAAKQQAAKGPSVGSTYGPAQPQEPVDAEPLETETAQENSAPADPGQSGEESEQ